MKQAVEESDLGGRIKPEWAAVFTGMSTIREGMMNIDMKKQILSEIESLPETKVASLLDYLHFLKQEKQEYYPNAETIEALQEDRSTFSKYDTVDELFDELGINL
ncbi:hypothetical protein [Oceanispirochaeta sp.]|jgi:uncharacterized protein YfbU (UPF0304 family)|uniref:hypothetical protein n=1 Tax=Oceanispirochaeta sp. TaxID=2035350 RepID=UPI0026056037|nr:hypothetical protein [Oceanispirochaeta sp.]MDA3958005.1 hypothetical protein [Oceanispirochaeta sp.]